MSEFGKGYQSIAQRTLQLYLIMHRGVVNGEVLPIPVGVRHAAERLVWFGSGCCHILRRFP